MKKVYKILIALLGLIVVAVIFPFSLNQPTPAGNIYPNSTCLGCNENPDYLIINLLIILTPIIAILGIIVLFFPSKKKEVIKNE